MSCYYVDCSESVSLPLLDTVFNFHASIYVIVASWADLSRGAWKVLWVGIFGQMAPLYLVLEDSFFCFGCIPTQITLITLEMQSYFHAVYC